MTRYTKTGRDGALVEIERLNAALLVARKCKSAADDAMRVARGEVDTLRLRLEEWDKHGNSPGYVEDKAQAYGRVAQFYKRALKNVVATQHIEHAAVALRDATPGGHKTRFVDPQEFDALVVKISTMVEAGMAWEEAQTRNVDNVGEFLEAFSAATAAAGDVGALSGLKKRERELCAQLCERVGSRMTAMDRADPLYKKGHRAAVEACAQSIRSVVDDAEKMLNPKPCDHADAYLPADLPGVSFCPDCGEEGPAASANWSQPKDLAPKPEKTKPTCATCKFSRAYADTSAPGVSVQAIECCRYPPQFVMEGVDSTIGPYLDSPSVGDGDWCGEHQQKDPK